MGSQSQTWRDFRFHFSGVSEVKNPAANAGGTSSILGLGRSSGEGNGNLPGKSHGQRSLEVFSPWGLQRVRHESDRYFLKSQNISHFLFSVKIFISLRYSS